MPHWRDLPNLDSLLRVESRGDAVSSSTVNERNSNGRIYGGQMLGQMVLAAGSTVDDARRVTALQLIFVKGGDPDRPLDYTVTPLQDGARFSSRHVGITQSGRAVADGHISFQVPASGPSHQIDPDAQCGDPEMLAALPDLDRSLHERMSGSGYSALDENPFVEYRFPQPAQLTPTQACRPFHVWMRVRRRLPDPPRVHAAALAYLSDLWLNFAGVAPYIPQTGSGRLYVASLNHSLWFHAPCRADQWLLCTATSPRLEGQRGLCTASLHSRDGVLVASMAQESLQTAADP